MKLGEAIYKSQQKEIMEEKDDKQKPDSKMKIKKENVVDADFEEVKEDKKIKIKIKIKIKKKEPKV